MKTFHKKIGAVNHAPGKVFEMLHTILLIRIQAAMHLSTFIVALRVVCIYPHSSSPCSCLSKPIQAKANE
ncbi:unnamed protein product [Musa textilis]